MTHMPRFIPPSGDVAPAWAGELKAMMDAYQQAGGDPKVLELPQVATLVISANQVLVAHEIPGVHFEPKACHMASAPVSGLNLIPTLPNPSIYALGCYRRRGSKRFLPIMRSVIMPRCASWPTVRFPTPSK